MIMISALPVIRNCLRMREVFWQLRESVKMIKERAARFIKRWSVIKNVKYGLDRICLFLIIACLLVIGLREVTFTKDLIKRFLFLFGGQSWVEQVRTFYDTKMWKFIYRLLLGSVITWGVEQFVIRGICAIKDRKLKTENDFEKHLFSYLDNTNKTRKCFAILGGWGTGKTYRLEQALARYRYYKFRPFYQISCFGLNEREDIMDAIKSECRHQDASMMQMMINWVQYLPAIGPWLSAVLEKRYELGDLAGNSVFIFEDFERIACGDDDKKEKYNLLVGFINEIVERYHYKVIIVCNHEEMDSHYNELIHKKLECEEYKHPSQNEEAYQIAELEFRNDNRLSKEEVYTLLMVVQHEIRKMIFIFDMAKMSNLRKLIRVFRALAVYAKEADLGINQDYFYHYRCILYSALYREILEEANVNLFDQHIKDYGGLFFDIYTGVWREFPDQSDAILHSLLYAPEDLVFLHIEPGKMNTTMRLTLDRIIESEREETECFSRWLNPLELGDDWIKSSLYCTPYGLLSLLKSLIYRMILGTTDSDAYRYNLEVLKNFKVENMEANVLYFDILDYLYDLRMNTYEIQKDYVSVVKIFLSAIKPIVKKLNPESQKQYQEMLEWSEDYADYALNLRGTGERKTNG